MKPVSSIPQSSRLLDQLREVLRYKHDSLRTEEAYLYWVKFFVRWDGLTAQERLQRAIKLACAAAKIVQAGLLGQSDASTTMVYTHVLKIAAGGAASPLDSLLSAQ